MKGRKSSSEERSEIEKEYRECLKRFNRMELISTFSYVPINSVVMAEKIISLSAYTNQQLLQMILNRDVEETLKRSENA